MNRTVLIIGAGSIGNHHTFAARQQSFGVTVYDKDVDALERMRHDIYPSRYGSWDDSVKLFNDITECEKLRFDLVIIGTPPDSHLSILEYVLNNIECSVILIEKPLASPLGEHQFNRLESLNANSSPRLLIAYNHRLTELTNKLVSKILESALIMPQFVTCIFQESWDGIFRAHPWLDGPEDSYLGYLERGGGAAYEHSHALNLFLFIIETLNLGKIVYKKQHGKFTESDKLFYDHHYSSLFMTSKGVSGLVIQDVISKINKKSLKIDYYNGSLEWVYGYDDSHHAIITTVYDKVEVELIKANRTEDFRGQMIHIKNLLDNPSLDSVLDFNRNIETQKILEEYYINIKKD